MNKLEKIKKEFPIFQNHPYLVYLDSAATTQTPQVVLSAMNEYYAQYRANIHRGLYRLSAEATEKYEDARAKVARLINAETDEIIFTNGTTHGLNHLAYALGPTLQSGDNIVLTRLEHHANIVPWLRMQKKFGFEIRYIELTTDYRLQPALLRGRTTAMPIDERTKIVSMIHISNALGTINPVKEIIDKAKSVGAISIIDAAQSVARMPIDVKDLDCDFLVFSGHKMYGPTGIGVLYGKQERLRALEPFFYGGDMINEVTYESASWADIPARFEGGTPNIAGAIGLCAAVDFMEKIGYDAILRHETELTEYALGELQKIEGLSIIGLTSDLGEGHGRRTGVISFTIAGIHPHDIASILDEHHVAVRAGHHCAMPLMRHLGLSGTVRLSVGIYNQKEDVDKLITGLKYAQQLLYVQKQ